MEKEHIDKELVYDLERNCEVFCYLPEKEMNLAKIINSLFCWGEHLTHQKHCHVASFKKNGLRYNVYSCIQCDTALVLERVTLSGTNHFYEYGYHTLNSEIGGFLKEEDKVFTQLMIKFDNREYKDLFVEVCEDLTIGELKRRIEFKRKIPRDSFHLTLNDRPLNNDTSLLTLLRRFPPEKENPDKDCSCKTRVFTLRTVSVAGFLSRFPDPSNVYKPFRYKSFEGMSRIVPLEFQQNIYTDPRNIICTPMDKKFAFCLIMDLHEAYFVDDMEVESHLYVAGCRKPYEIDPQKKGVTGIGNVLRVLGSTYYRLNSKFEIRFEMKPLDLIVLPGDRKKMHFKKSDKFFVAISLYRRKHRFATTGFVCCGKEAEFFKSDFAKSTKNVCLNTKFYVLQKTRKKRRKKKK